MKDARIRSKNTSIRKWLIGLGVIIGIILLTLYFYKWHQVKEQEKYLTSYLIKSNTISLEMNDISEINAVLSETPSYYFVYISYNEDKEIYEFEKELKPLIDEYNLQNSFYYINVTQIKKDNNYKEKLAKELNISEKELKNIPVILYFKDSKLSNPGVTKVEDFKKLLEDKNIKAM